MSHALHAADDTMPPLLHVEGLDKRFFATHAVNDVSFDVQLGEIVALLGENGAGKSTVIKMLAGVYKPDEGTMTVHGVPIADARSDVAFIHQNLGLVEWMTVAENIALTVGYPRRFGMVSTRMMREQAAEILDAVGGGIDPDTRVFDLPRTERSLLAIARGLPRNPRLLVLDEPTASLPQADVERLFAVLRRLRDQGVGMLYVSHRLDEIFEITSRAVIMRSGRMVHDGPVEDLSHGELIDLIVGRETVQPRFSPPQEEVRLSLQGFRSGEVGPVDLDVRAGEIVALCGLRGSGQDVVGRAVTGVARTSGGELHLDGQPYTPGSPAAAVAQGVGFATSNREAEAVAPGMSVAENLFLNPHVWGRRLMSWMTPATERARAQGTVDEFGVRPRDPAIALDTLSGGNQQKIILARWFGVGRRLVVLEEPTMGVDVGAKADIYQILSRAAQEGTSAIVVSTDMEEVARIAHRAIVFGRGQVVAHLTGEDITIANLVAAASDLDREQESAA